MEIHLDTSILSQNYNKNKFSATVNQTEMTINTEIDNFIKKSISLNKDGPNFKEYFLISIDYFLLEKTEKKSVVLYGKILENNQSFYEYNVNDKVFVFANNSLVINNLISLFVGSSERKNINMKIDIDECLIIQNNMNSMSINSTDLYSDFSNLNNSIFLKMIFLPSILKIYFSIYLKFKFSKWESILINSKFPEESFLLNKILTLIGYEVYINKSNFMFNIKKEELNIFEENSKNLIEIDEQAISQHNFNFIIDTTGDLLSSKNKLNAFSILKFDGRLISLDCQNSSIYKQLDPRDIEYISIKNLNLCFTNTDNSLKFNKFIGKELNFINEIYNKLVSVSNIHPNNLKILVKKLNCKIIDRIDNLNDIKFEEIVCTNNYMNLYTI